MPDSTMVHRIYNRRIVVLQNGSGMMQRFANKVALISGATSGIGRVTAQRMLDEGGTVVFVALTMRLRLRWLLRVMAGRIT